MKLEPNTFPIDNQLEQINNSLHDNDCLLIKAETGAGKTTRLPPYLVGKTQGKVLVLEPRRLAAKLSAQRCAKILNSELGQRVGHHIRFDKKSSPETSLLFITEGLFLPYLREDNQLSEYSIIILDEFHERSIHTDMALALIRKLQQTSRPDLKLIIMSATLDTSELESFLSISDKKIRIFDIPGRVYPIEIEYHESELKDAIVDMLADPRCPQNILVFLPGLGAIKALEAQLGPTVPKKISIVPLHSALSKKLQSRAFEGSDRKIILSTNIAETSLTIPNITGVVDTGTERQASFAPWSGMPLLQLEKISKASATQRAGRAGRVQSGIVYRMYNQNEYAQRVNFTPPEIKRVELSHYLLDLIELGHNPETLQWFESPDEKNFNKALELLKDIGALNKNSITPLGSFIAKLPLQPRFGAMIYNAFIRQKCKYVMPEVLLAVCLLNEGPAYSKQTKFSNNSDIDSPEDSDLTVQMDLIKAHYHNDTSITDYHSSMLDQRAYKRIIELYHSLAIRLKINKNPIKEHSKLTNLTQALLAGYPDRIAAKRKLSKKGKSKESYNFCMGRGGILSPRSSLSSSSPNFIIVLDALENPKANAAIGTSITSASKVTIEELKTYNSHWISEDQESQLNEKTGSLSLTTITKYKNITLNTNALAPVIPKGEVLKNLMIKNWPWPFENDHDLKLYHTRINILDNAKIEHQCPQFVDEMFELLIESIIDEDTSFQSIKKQGLKNIINSQLAPQDQYVLDTQVPLEIQIGEKRKYQIRYDDDSPYIEARIQDLFSITIHPAIANQSLPLVIRLMSPANKTIQLTRDINQLWGPSWNALRQDLRPRYPKHYWPDDPATAKPIRMKKDVRAEG